MRIVLVLRLTLFTGVCALLVCGCQRGGSPTFPSLTDNAAPSLLLARGGSGEPAKPAVPKLRWMITEPADLLEEGWGHYPATVATSITFAASLWGTSADEFDGNVNLTVDGEPYPFDCTGKTLTAQIMGLGRGMHHVQVHAGSAVGIDNRTFAFVVVDSPPFMQVGIGEDGKVYATLSRKMPASQLGDLTRWTCEKFNTDKVSVEMLSDNRTVALGMADPLSVDDMSWLPPDGSSPVVRFQSSLGDVVGKLLPEADKDGHSESRSAQSEPGCDEGSIYGHGSAGHCDPDLDWFIERHSLESSDSEPRAVFNTEVPIPVMGWPPLWYPWRNCYNLVIVRFNSVEEGHLDPPNSWNAEYDTVWHASQSEDYFGVGFQDWRFQLYERDHSYYPPSWCSYGWWSFEVDGNWCDPEIPAYFKSKGSWNGEGFDDGPIFVDHDPPFFGDNIEDPYGGIDVLLGSELDQSSDPYIASLYADLAERGNLYKSNGARVISQQDFWTYYWNNVGSDVDADEPVVVVRAQDKPSDQGRYIKKFLAGDYTYLGQNYADDEMAEHLFYADVSPYAPDELTEEYWPVPVGEQIVPMRLPVDGDAKGEFSVWILPVDCALLNGDISSFRLRITDDVNNWRRSPEFITAIPQLEIVQPSGCGETPDDRCQFSKDETIVFEAAMTGVDELLDQTEVRELIQWYVLKKNEQGEWDEIDKEHYPQSGFESIITQESWSGPSFTVLLKDHEFQVRAELVICGVTFYDDCFVKNPWEVVDLTFLDDLNENRAAFGGDETDFIKGRRSQCPDSEFLDGLVLTRDAERKLFLYALLIGDEDSMPHSIPVTVNAPYEDSPPPAPQGDDRQITTYLYQLTPGSPNGDPENPSVVSTYQEIMDIFNYPGSEPPDERHIYCRGTNLQESPPANLILVSDALEPRSSEDDTDLSSPVLYVSNRDDQLEGATDYRDYSVAYGLEAPADMAKVGALVEEKLSPIRGVYDVLPCGDLGDGQNLKYNVMSFGMENVVAECGELQAQIAVESEADILFLLGHGDVQWEFGKRGHGESYFLGFEPPANTPESARDSCIFSGDFAGDYLPQADAKYIISPACWILAKGESYPDLIWPPEGWTCYDEWQGLIGRSSPPFIAICGHVRYHEDQGDDEIEGFWTPLIDRIRSGDYQFNEDLWQCEPSSDYVVICYMQTAAEYCSQFAWGKYRDNAAKRADVISFGAIDAGNRYYLWYVGADQTVILKNP